MAATNDSKIAGNGHHRSDGDGDGDGDGNGNGNGDGHAAVQALAGPAMARRISTIVAERTGRTPAAVDALMAPGLVTVTIRDPLTEGEQTLRDAGGERGVIELRDELRPTLRVEVVAAVEHQTGRTVEAFLLAHHVDPDVTVQTFLLSPDGDGNGDGASADGHDGAP